MLAVAPLKNRRREAFCLEVGCMASPEEAYRLAGYDSGRFSSQNARKLLQQPEVRERVSELQAEHRARSGDLLTWAQAQLIRIVEGRPHDDIPERLGAMATRIVVGPDGKRTTTIDRMAAIEWLLKSMGLGTDSVTATAIAGAAAEPEPRSDLDTARRIAFLLSQAAVPMSNGTDIVDNTDVSSTSVQHESTARQKPNDINGGNEPATMFFNGIPCPPESPVQHAADPAAGQPQSPERQFSLDLEREAERQAPRDPDKPVTITFAPLPGASK